MPVNELLYLYQASVSIMKQLTLLIILTLCSFNLLFAQAFLSSSPVDEGSYDVSNSISGTWKVEKYRDAGQAYSIMADPNKKGQVNIIHGLGTMTPAILSKINNHIYLSLYEVGGPEQQTGFYIFHLEMLSPTQVRLTPLKYELNIPEGQSLAQYLQQPGLKLQDILQPHAIRLTNKHFTIKRPLDTNGRKINIVRKK